MAGTVELETIASNPVNGGVSGSVTFKIRIDDGPAAYLLVAVPGPVANTTALITDAWERLAAGAGEWITTARREIGENAMDQIEHVVVLMLENRGFDHALGWLYENDHPLVNLPAGPARPASQANLRDFEGLAGLDLATLTNIIGESPETALVSSPPIRGASSPIAPPQNPHEDYVHICADMFGAPFEQLKRGDIKPANVTMKGYLADFATNFDDAWDPVAYKRIMETYLPAQLPVLNGLAKHYGVSDQWFCSVPSQTNTNRAFLLAGTARGMVTNGFYPYKYAKKSWASDQLPADTRTLFDVLEENGKGAAWMYFWSGNWPPYPTGDWTYVRIMFPRLADKKYDTNFAKIDDFFTRAKAGTLPAVSFLEPEFGGGATIDATLQKNTNDYHPVQDLTKAEDFVQQVYDAVSRGPAWSKTLLLITFDENGGTYDHVPPPAATPSTTPASNADVAPLGYEQRDLDKDTRTQLGFGFDMFGVRVPTLAISPWVAKSTVFRSPTDVPFDHTSVIATILEWQGVDRAAWNLGQRTAAAPTFDLVVSLDQPRDPSDASVGLAFGTRPVRAPNAVPLTYGMTFRLQHTGNPWGPGQDPGTGLWWATAARSLLTYYPQVSARASDAVTLRLVSPTKALGQPVLNNDVVLVVSTESDLGSANVLGAWADSANLYYAKAALATDGGQSWSVRLPAYRVSGEPVYVGDQVFFASLRAKYAYQRIVPEAPWLNSKLGAWAIWTIMGQG
jgi:phospholipase C